MLTFEELYKKVVAASSSKEYDEELAKLEYDPYHLECILTPETSFQAWKNGHESCSIEGKTFINCLFNHINQKEPHEKCKECIDKKQVEELKSSKDIMAVLKAIEKGEQPVFACVAPAFLSQFEILSDGQLRSAFKQIGFAGMVEVSLFADILTLKESLEFDKEINNEDDFQLTSCCCPVWISLIRKMHPDLFSHVPKAVSPMIATGRAIKRIVPNAFTVFVGPCMAKKVEAREDDIKEAIDVVLTFQEVKDIFESARINAKKLPTDLREHSSSGGRIYAITSGVSEAVSKSVKRLRPERPIQVKAIQGNGIIECRQLLKDLKAGKIEANFIEGMGCVGGCVGGPRSLIDTAVASEKVRKYSGESLYQTPIDNPYVIELLHRLDIHTIDALLEDHEIFTRSFE